MVVLLASVPAAVQAVTHEFEGNHFTLELPPGYQLIAEASPKPGSRLFDLRPVHATMALAG